MDKMLNRFVFAFFGRTECSPTKDEYGMYAAKSASLRSADLSRQVGAAVFTRDGELLTQGCNEVPKAFGGTYWDQEEPDFRDVKLMVDPNDEQKREVVRDFLERLWDAKLLSDKATTLGTPLRLLSSLICRATDEQPAGPLVGSKVMDLIEFGRVVHAEMCAICDAARLGRSLKGSILYCTTFPCRNCAKHILAAGIRRVVYMEPYPKSKVKDLHPHEIEIENETDEKVSFVPFLGIAPHRYRDIFQKGKRKNDDGTARKWIARENRAEPMLEIVFEAYTSLEKDALGPLIGETRPEDTHRDDE